MTAKDVTVAPKILSGNSVPKEKGYGIYCIYLLEKLSCTPKSSYRNSTLSSSKADRRTIQEFFNT